MIDFFFLSICTAAKENIYIYTWEPQLIKKIRAGHAQGHNNSIHGHPMGVFAQPCKIKTNNINCYSATF